MGLSLTKRLPHILLQAIGLDRPCAEHRLIDQNLLISIGSRFARIQAAPAAQASRPFLWDVGKHVDSSAHVLAAFRVMRGAGVHRVRGASVPLEIAAMEFFDAKVQFRAIGVGADLVDRDQRVVGVERRVFQSLRHHWSGELLPPHSEEEILLLALLQVPRGLHKEYATKKRERRAFSCNGDRFLYPSAVRFRNVRIPNVGPIDGQTRCDRYQCFFQILRPDISRVPVFLRQFRQTVEERADFSGKEFLHHLAFSFSKNFGKGPVGTGEFGINLFETVKTFGVEECAVDEIEEVVACGSVGTPVARNALGSGKYLFDHNVDCRQPVQITFRVQKAVNVIDPEARHLAAGNKLQYAGVSRVKNILSFDTQADEIRDIAKSPVVDRLGSFTPER